MKKILFLGGSHSQVPAIRYAVDAGHYVITCDYKPDNPGHQLSHEYHNVSTTDKEAVLELAKSLQIDAISPFASDPAAPTAAYVSERLNLVGASFKSVEILSNKHLFRSFLKEHGFRVPWFIYGSEPAEMLNKYNGEPAILKPVDSSGSKGIFKIESSDDIVRHFLTAKKFSKTGTVILEEYIQHKGPQIHGEGFVLDGKLVFAQLGDQVFSTVNKLVPYSTIIPGRYHQDIMEQAVKEVESVIEKTGFSYGGINIELIRDRNDVIYILEIGARNGGNFMPQLIRHATGFDMVKAHIDSLTGEKIELPPSVKKSEKEWFAQIILHSDKKGIFKGIHLPAGFDDCIVEQHIYYKEGSLVNRYENSRDVIGVLILKINNYDEYLRALNQHAWIDVERR